LAQAQSNDDKVVIMSEMIKELKEQVSNKTEEVNQLKQQMFEMLMMNKDRVSELREQMIKYQTVTEIQEGIKENKKGCNIQ